MRKKLVLSILFLGILVLSFPVNAQRLPEQESLKKEIEEAIARQIPATCLHDYCFHNAAEGVAYCQGFARAVTKEAALPDTEDSLLSNTLAYCQHLLKWQEDYPSCPSLEAYKSAQEKGYQKGRSLFSSSQNPAPAQIDYIEGYRQLGQGVVQVVKAANSTLKEGYQNIAEGYTKANYAEGYRDIYQAIKKSFQRKCHKK